jgi:hypothetical protein
LEHLAARVSLKSAGQSGLYRRPNFIFRWQVRDPSRRFPRAFRQRGNLVAPSDVAGIAAPRMIDWGKLLHLTIVRSLALIIN